VREIADGLHQLRGFPPHAFNVYLMGDVLVDPGSRHAHRRILGQLRGHRVSAHALTHAHPDHQGSSHRVCETLGIPYWVGEGDVAAAESGDIARFQPDRAINRAMHALMSGPGRKVDRVLHEGDEVAGFTPDPARNRDSIRRVAELRPAVACLGHGPPVRDPGKLAEFAASLP
jgi:hydroxyacylglutathione hydrolase